MKDSRKMVYIIGSITLVIVGIVVIPRLTKKITDIIYKKSHNEIDFDEQGPEIVKKETKEV